MSTKTVKINKFIERFTALLKHPFFWILTVGGNSIILVGSLLLYIFEKNNQSSLSFLDSVLWSTGTVTTIGYGNYHPESILGKVTLLILMLAGTLFVWSYMAFLVTALISPELTSIEKDVHDVEKEIQELKHEDKYNNEINKVSKPLVKKAEKNEK